MNIFNNILKKLIKDPNEEIVDIISKSYINVCSDEKWNLIKSNIDDNIKNTAEFLIVSYQITSDKITRQESPYYITIRHYRDLVISVRGKRKDVKQFVKAIKLS